MKACIGRRGKLAFFKVWTDPGLSLFIESGVSLTCTQEFIYKRQYTESENSSSSFNEHSAELKNLVDAEIRSHELSTRVILTC